MLTAQQIEARRGKLTASRVSVLMTGDAEGILNLWREMTGDPEFVPVDLSDVWPVQLGEATEKLNLRWFEMKNKCLLDRIGEVVVHPVAQWAACTLDGWSVELQCPIECKHVGGREPLEVVIDRYAPQCQFQMEITGARQCLLSVIMGANPPIVEVVERSDVYIAEMMKRGAQFMDYVARRVPPVALPAVPAPADASKIYDMSGSNEWCSHAMDWLDNRDAAKAADEAQKILKNMVPPDAKKVFGGGVRVTRDRAGRLSLREEN